MSEEKVCPNCGNNRFTTERVTSEVVRIDGNGEVQKVIECNDTEFHNGLHCTDCDIHLDGFDQLVSESYFHEVIAPKQV